MPPNRPPMWGQREVFVWIPTDAIAIVNMYDRLGNTVLGLWFRSEHSADMDWDIAKKRIDDPTDRVVRAERVWLIPSGRVGQREEYP